MGPTRWRERVAARLRVPVLLALTYLLGVAAVWLGSFGQSTAAWWPASGVAVLAVLATSPRRAWLVGAAVGVVTAASNAAAGRPLPLAAAFGAILVVECLVVAALIRRRGRFRVPSVGDVGAFLLAAAIGAVIAGVLAGLTVAALADGDFWATAPAVAASHGSAIVTIVPLAVPRVRVAAMRRAPGALAQWISLVGVVALVFGPPNALPLSFVPMPVLVWGALVHTTRVVAVQLVGVALVITTLTALGLGPFAGAEGITALQRNLVVQGFLVTYAASILLLSAARTEQLLAVEERAARQQLLHGGIVDAQVGLVIMQERAGGELLVLQSNARAVELLGGAIPQVDDAATWEEHPLVPDIDGDEHLHALRRAVRQAAQAPDGESYSDYTRSGPDGRQVELIVNRRVRPGGEWLVTAQLVDVTERHRADLAVRRALSHERRAAERLRAVSRQKDEFVSAVSHELRTPITSIIGFVELLEDEGELTAEQREHLAVVERNARRLAALVEDLLALGSRVDRTPVDVDVGVLIRRSIEDHLPAARARGVDLRAGRRSSVHVRFVVEDMERILTNLLGNALKFTPAGGRVQVDVLVDDEHVRVRIADTGSGVAPDELTRVFDRFYRSPTAVEGSVPGVGLGLALVRELAVRNHATVHLDSDGVSGTTAELVVSLPARRPFPSPVPVVGGRGGEPVAGTPPESGPVVADASPALSADDDGVVHR